MKKLQCALLGHDWMWDGPVRELATTNLEGGDVRPIACIRPRSCQRCHLRSLKQVNHPTIDEFCHFDLEIGDSELTYADVARAAAYIEARR